MNPGPEQVYVYYRVRHADAAALIAGVRAMQAGLQVALPGLICNLSRRAHDGAELMTVMETYARVDGVPAAWQRDIEQQAQRRLAAWIIGERHAEVFVPLVTSDDVQQLLRHHRSG